MSGTTTHTIGHSDIILFDTIQLSLDLVGEILLQINNLDLLNESHKHFTNMHLTKLSLDITQFVELTTLLSKVLGLRKKISPTEIKESHIHLLFVLKGINQAQLKNDDVILEDLIKHELKDNLTAWKIEIIPKIKKLITI